MKNAQEVVKEICKLTGLSQYKISLYLDVSQSTINNWATGKYNPSIDSLQSLAKLFGYELVISVGELRGAPFEIIKLIRHKLGISQMKIATILGVDSTTVRRWEYGKPISLYQLNRVAGLINEEVELNIEYFYDWKR